MLAPKQQDQELLSPLQNLSGSHLNVAAPQHSDLKSSWVARTFGRMEDGSIRGGLFTLSSSAMGASTLTLPFIFKTCGLVLGIVILLFGYTINFVSLRILDDATWRHEIYNYGKLTKALIGKGSYKVVEIMILIYSLGIIIGFQIIAGQLAVQTFVQFGASFDPVVMRIILMVVLNFGFMLPLSLLRDLSQLRMTSMVSPLALTWIAIVALVEFPFYYQQHGLDGLVLAKLDENIFSCIVIPLVGYMCHTNVISVLGKIDNPIQRRMQKMTDRMLTLVVLIYLLIGTFGYLCTLGDTKSLITSNEPPNDVNPNVPMIIGWILMIFGLVFSIPVNVSPCRASILVLLKKQKANKLSHHRIITVALWLISLGVAIGVPDVLIVFNFLGGIWPIALVGIYPSLIFVRQHEEVPTWQKAVFISVVVFLTLIGAGAVIVTIIQILRQMIKMTSTCVFKMDQPLLQKSSPYDSGDFDGFSFDGCKQRTWSQRTFSLMTPGSVRGGLFTLASSALGASTLLLPYIMMQSGLVLSLIILILWSIINFWSLRALINACDQYKIYNYADLLNKVIGRWAKVACDVITIVYSIGILIGFQIIVGKLTYNLCLVLEIQLPEWAERSMTLAFMNWFIILPISSFRDLSRLRFTAIVGVTSLTYIVLVTMVEFPLFMKQHGVPEIDYFVLDANIFSSISVPLLAFFCHTNVWTVFGQINNPTVRRMEKITGRCTLIQLSIYIALCVFGYLSTGRSTPKVFIMREGPQDWETDWPMTVGKICMLLTLVLGIPLNLHPCRLALFNSLGKPDPPMWLHFVITVALLEVTLIIAIVTPNVIVVFNFLGGIGSITLLAVFPGLVFLKTRKLGEGQRWLTWGLIYGLSAVGIATCLVTVKTMLQE